MKHSFILSILGSDKCAKCNRAEIDHTNLATCEACPNVGDMQMYPDVNGMLLCNDCIAREESIRLSPESQQARVTSLNDVIKTDQSIKLRSDIFNAETVSIVAIKDIIDKDESIVNKHFKLAEVITTRLNLFKKAIFEKSEELVELNNKQQAIQSYLNDLANKLRIDEREKIKLQDIEYKPISTKVTKPRTSVTPKKFDKSEIRKYAVLANVPESVLQMVCIAKNMTPEQAMNSLKKAVESIK